MDQLSQTAEIYGILRAVISALFVTVIGLPIIIFLIILYNKNKNYKSTKAKIIEPNCDELIETSYNNNHKKQITNKYFSCNMNLEYYVNKNKIENKIIKSNSNVKYQKNDTISIGYLPNDPYNISLDYKSKKNISIIGIIVIITIMLLTFLNLYLVIKYKLVARVQGALGFASNLKSILSRK